jgi:electron transfer flavoprotein alpha subunit
MGTILIVAEIQGAKIREASFELASFAQKIAAASNRTVASLVMGKGSEERAQELAKRGGGKVYAAEHDALAQYSPESALIAIKAAVAAAGADLVLISNTPSGWDIAPRLAAALDAGFVSDAFAIDADANGLTFKRRVFNGKLDATIRAGSGKVVATVQPGATAPYAGQAAGSVEKLAVTIDPGALRSRFVGIKQSESKGVDLTKADIIVSGGRGVSNNPSLQAPAGMDEKQTELWRAQQGFACLRGP